MAYREAEKTEIEKEMDVVRNRLRDLEEASGLARAWKRVTIGLVAFGIMACGATYATVGVMVKRAKNPCKDSIVEIHAGDKVMSCPHPEHKLESVQGGSTAWGIQCMCQR
jgi:hypothetical protein